MGSKLEHLSISCATSWPADYILIAIWPEKLPETLLTLLFEVSQRHLMGCMHWDMKCKAATAANSQHEYEMNCLCWWFWTWIWNEYEYEINEWIWMNEWKNEWIWD